MIKYPPETSNQMLDNLRKTSAENQRKLAARRRIALTQATKRLKEGGQPTAEKLVEAQQPNA